MEKYGWNYQDLLDTPKVIYDYVVELMDIEAQKNKADQAQAERKQKAGR